MRALAFVFPIGRIIGAASLGLIACCPPGHANTEEPVLELGGRRELMADRWLLADFDGAGQRLHPPVSAGTVLQMDEPWEGRYSTYATVFRDGDVFRLYYRGRAALPEVGDPVAVDQDLEWQVTCYAESIDGVRWTKPRLGQYEVLGRRDNNVVLARSVACANFTPFIDTRPGVPASERYKALGGVHSAGLRLFASADALHWKEVRRLAGVDGAFDSQNVAFWSETEHQYVLYFRTWSSGTAYRGHREISRTTSPDLVAWSAPQRMTWSSEVAEEFYTQQTQPYFRAPQLYVAFPSRFLPSRRVLGDDEFAAAGIWPRSRTSGVNDGLFMTSRGGTRYDLTFREAYVRPGPDRRNWSPRNTYAALGLLQTGPGELSLYYVRNYAQPSNHLERFVTRLDGFASIFAGAAGGTVLTRPFRFSGAALELNYATSASGSVRVELCDATGAPLPGFSRDECEELVGDELGGVVHWRRQPDLSRFAGQPVRLRFVLEDSDVYALQFMPSSHL